MKLTIISVLTAFGGQLFETSWANTSLLIAIGFVTLSLIWRRKDIF